MVTQIKSRWALSQSEVSHFIVRKYMYIVIGLINVFPPRSKFRKCRQTFSSIQAF